MESIQKVTNWTIIGFSTWPQYGLDFRERSRDTSMCMGAMKEAIEEIVTIKRNKAEEYYDKDGDDFKNAVQNQGRRDNKDWVWWVSGLWEDKENRPTYVIGNVCMEGSGQQSDSMQTESPSLDEEMADEVEIVTNRSVLGNSNFAAVEDGTLEDLIRNPYDAEDRVENLPEVLLNKEYTGNSILDNLSKMGPDEDEGNLNEEGEPEVGGLREWEKLCLTHIRIAWPVPWSSDDPSALDNTCWEDIMILVRQRRVEEVSEDTGDIFRTMESPSAYQLVR
ncbi:hypothetical protein L1987_25536 [Smallanthus sonchifolius]|uniref:Uncharacterized protein n=1 Tax=Smallanthus sonchifolius TaxID=185202 RepID=A0ACB9IMR4_9ASTR|nr:hypothetical protein L1987_25536 [Smallanthus sonchifolius]